MQIEEKYIILEGTGPITKNEILSLNFFWWRGFRIYIVYKFGGCVLDMSPGTFLERVGRRRRGEEEKRGN